MGLSSLGLLLLLQPHADSKTPPRFSTVKGWRGGFPEARLAALLSAVLDLLHQSNWPGQPHVPAKYIPAERLVLSKQALVLSKHCF